ncbi:MAG TPA: MurT ligase domain-containing protein, partial [Dehalococcoidia bacterium]|nr:MurT ligase domain-containing protein [Dehalococcoidia bacterium]
MPSPRTLAAVWSAKAAATASRVLAKGGGTAIGGLVGLALQPHLVAELARGLGRGSVVITGTNGKTTTSHLIADVARAAGLRPLANASGSNLMRGLAGTLASAAGPGGGLADDKRTIGVFEVDEAALPQAIEALRPRVAVFTNLFRDQLDRYGEVEAVAARWREALAATAHTMTLVLNADDPTVASLAESSRHRAVYFGVNDKALDRGCLEHAADAITCTCGGDYEYGIAFYSHLGHWRCPECGRMRPSTQITAREVDLRDGRSLAFTLGAAERGVKVEMAVGGLYNVYNALAATAAALALGLPEEALLATLPRFRAAFGRQEAFEIEGRRVEVMLGKNPAGLNQVLHTLTLDPSRRTVLFVLNDRIADGRDISWIWDADFEAAAGRFDVVVCSGTRAEEMALRLKYAEWDEA